jgi:hypothetical protein
MTPQEAQMLQDLVSKVESTQLTEKDSDAEALLNDGLSRDPDAMYKLAQTVLVQNIALNQARAQIDQLRQQPVPQQQPARATSFLGGLFGHRDPAAPPPPQYQSPQAPPQYQAVPQYAAPQYAPPQYASGPQAVYGQPTSGAGSFLRSAATTAAGVAAGALAFEGIESLLHGGHGGFMGGGYEPGFGGGYGMGGGNETVVNNYYGNEGANQSGGYDPGVAGADMQPQGPYDDSGNADPDMQPQGGYDASSDPDMQPQGGDVETASYDPSNDASFDDQNMDDSSFGGDGGGDNFA